MKEEILKTVVDHKEIKQILPHRYPFLLVDRIVHLDLEGDKIIGQKNLTMNEQFFEGHFPGNPIMPGVLILEALAQTGAILAYKKGFTDKIAVFLKIDGVRFRKPAYPGDVLFLLVEGIRFSGIGAKVKVRAYINTLEGRPAVEAEIACALVSRNQI